jgi:hypothetical protein
MIDNETTNKIPMMCAGGTLFTDGFPGCRRCGMSMAYTGFVVMHEDATFNCCGIPVPKDNVLTWVHEYQAGLPPS